MIYRHFPTGIPKELPSIQTRFACVTALHTNRYTTGQQRKITICSRFDSDNSITQPIHAIFSISTMNIMENYQCIREFTGPNFFHFHAVFGKIGQFIIPLGSGPYPCDVTCHDVTLIRFLYNPSQ